MNAAASATSSALSLASALSSRSFGRTFTSACKHYHSHHQQMGDTTSSKSDGKALLVPPHYRFVTKTLKKVLQVCDFSETYLAQLSKTNMKVSKVEFHNILYKYYMFIVNSISFWYNNDVHVENLNVHRISMDFNLLLWNNNNAFMEEAATCMRLHAAAALNLLLLMVD